LDTGTGFLNGHTSSQKGRGKYEGSRSAVLYGRSERSRGELLENREIGVRSRKKGEEKDLEVGIRGEERGGEEGGEEWG